MSKREGRWTAWPESPREVRVQHHALREGQSRGRRRSVVNILRKAESIRKELGVLVPMPDDEGKLTQALMNAVLGVMLNAQS